MRKSRVIGNWKLNGSLAASQVLLSDCLEQAKGIKNVEIAVCPSFVYIPAVAEQLHGSNIALGAQNVCEHDKGAYTGEVSAAMLADFGCAYVIIGHSERRHIYGETQATQTQKIEQALAQGLISVYCVGETQSERENGQTGAAILEQLDPVIDQVGIEAFAKIVIAYEPVWAIGTGLAATSEQAQEVHAFIRQRLATADSDVAEKASILYGGSVKPANAAELFAQQDIDGGLIGGASLKADDFIAIAKAVA